MTELSEHIVSAPVVVLTGAGASFHLGKPPTKEFVEKVSSQLSPEHGRVWMGLLRSSRELWGTEVADVEMILEHVRDMRDLGTRASHDYNLAPHLKNARPIFEDYTVLEERLCELVVAEYADVDEVTAENLYGPLFTGLAHKFHTLPIFTLNYDLAVERATGRLGVRIVDGIRRGRPVESRWSAGEFGTYRPGGEFTIVLFKLHGSTSWAWHSDGSLVELHPGTGRDPGEFRHAVLYPYLTQKDVEREPFKTGYAYLDACLRRARWLVIIGTSLRDDHLLRILRGAIKANSGLALTLVDPRLDAKAAAATLGVSAGRIQGMKMDFDPRSSALLAAESARRTRLRGRRTKPAA